MTKSHALALVVFACILFPHFSGAQANVNEGLELYTFYVDTNAGSDSNPGTQAQPFKTIGWAASQAVINNQNNKGTHVWIKDGTYRESVTLNGSPADTSSPITFEAVHHGRVIVSGGVLYTGWSVYSGNSKIYTNAWNNTWGVCATPTGCPPSSYPQPDIMLRQEMVAVNGTVLTEVLSISQMQTGTFYVDTANKLIYVWPSSGTNMTTASVEVATLPTLLTLDGKSNIVVRGLVFQYANSCRSNPAVVATGSAAFPASNILFDSDTIQWNNGQGLAVGNLFANFTVENTSSIHNGDSGFQSFQAQLGLWEDDLVAYNNWRGGQGAYYSCNVAGFHSWEAHSDSLNGFTAKYNQTYGIHWDTDNVNISGTGVIASQNLVPGLFSEVNPGPIALSSSYACNQSSPISGAGLAIRDSEGVSFIDGLLYNNNGAQIAIVGAPGGIEITDWLTGEVYDLFTQGFSSTNNVIEGIGSAQSLFNDGILNGTDWTTFLLNFNSNDNTWWNASNSISPFIVPVPALSTSDNFSGWQLTTLQDLNSTFSVPSGSPENGCAVTADADDYWVAVDNPSVTANPAGEAIFNLSVIPLANFAGTVNFTLDGISEVHGLSASPPASIVTSGTTPLTVNSGETTAAGTYPVTVIANSGNRTRTVTVSVVVPVTSVRLSTGAINFASQQQNTTSPGQNIVVENTGRTALAITSVTASPDFALSKNTCGTSLNAGSNCAIAVTFTPRSIGPVNGTLTIVDGDVTSPQVVSLAGTGTGDPTVALSPPSLNFDTVLVNSASAPQTVTLINTGQGTLTFTGGNAAGITITGTNNADYTQGNNCGSSVAVGASCTITVTFTPQDSGSTTAAVTLTDNAENGTQTIALVGKGASPAVALTPSSLGFGKTEVKFSSGTMTSTLRNSGVVTLTISNVALSGTKPSEYSQTNTCIGSLAPGANCTISVIFSPTATGTQNASVTITDNTSAGSTTLNLTGSGVLPTAVLVPPEDSFGTFRVGTTSAAKVSTLNNASNYFLNIGSISIAGPNAADFAQTNTCPVGGTLAGSGTCTVSVTFNPLATGTRTATLTESDNSSAGTHTISLTGSGK